MNIDEYFSAPFFPLFERFEKGGMPLPRNYVNSSPFPRWPKIPGNITRMSLSRNYVNSSV